MDRIYVLFDEWIGISMKYTFDLIEYNVDSMNYENIVDSLKYNLDLLSIQKNI